MDATSDRDFVLEYINALTLLALHASRFAEEITLFATAEFGFVELPEAFSTGSSAMPQKKNPDLTELVRGKVGRINGAAQAVTLQLKGFRWRTTRICRRPRSRYSRQLEPGSKPCTCWQGSPSRLSSSKTACGPHVKGVSQRNGGGNVSGI